MKNKIAKSVRALTPGKMLRRAPRKRQNIGVIFCVFVCLVSSKALGLNEAAVRLEVTSVEFVDAKHSDVNRQARAANPEDEKTKNPQQIGVAKRVRVNFRVPDKLRRLENPYKVSKGEGRIGLFLKRDRGTHASVQRGTLENCETGFCSALFEDNALFRFYAENMKKPSEWFVQSLQNPAIEERWLELGAEPEVPWVFEWRAEARYSRQGLFLKETSSTAYNAFKMSQRVTYGNRYGFQLGLNNFELSYSTWSVFLSTEGFFADSFDTEYKGNTFSLGWGEPLGSYWLAGVQIGMDSAKFETTNDDEAILNSEYSGIPVGIYIKYIAPWDIFSIFGGKFALEVGRGKFGGDYNILSTVEDTGEWKRGSAGYWKKLQFYAEHFFITRARSIWLTDWKFGSWFQYAKASEVFSGDPEGPSTGLPVGTETSGNYFSWGFTFGRQYTW